MRNIVKQKNEMPGQFVRKRRIYMFRIAVILSLVLMLGACAKAVGIAG